MRATACTAGEAHRVWPAGAGGSFMVVRKLRGSRLPDDLPGLLARPVSGWVR
jgi:hypothetical protein